MNFLNVLITTSGTGERLGVFTKHTNKSLVKIGDKFAICHIIESYPDSTHFYITVGYHGQLVIDFLELAYPNHIFTFIWVDKYVGDGSSLGYSLLCARPYLLEQPFMFHCCDTIYTEVDFTKNVPYQGNTLIVYSTDKSQQYSSICVDAREPGKIAHIHNKGSDNFDYAYIGVAWIYNVSLFWKHLEIAYQSNPSNQSLNDIAIFIEMNQKENVPFYFRVARDWHDTGNPIALKQTQLAFPKKYCVLEKEYESICFLSDRVIKFVNDAKLNHKRYQRGLLLGNLAPKLLGCRENFIAMEFIQDGQPLSHSYDISIVRRLLEWTSTNLWTNAISDNSHLEHCKRFYIDKTMARINQWKYLENERNVVNGIFCGNIIDLIHKIPTNRICNSEFSGFHGDFILDNLLWSSSRGFVLIDWRQDFDGLLDRGDIYYDLAKLRHNLIFNHMNVDSGLFLCEEDIHNKDNVIVDLKCDWRFIKQVNDLENIIKEKKGFDIWRVRILTAIIWLNMAPLYEDELLSKFLFYFGKYHLWELLKDV